MKISWSTLRSMFISGSSRRPDQSFFFISRTSFYPPESFSREWTAFRCEQTENIQILYRPWRVSIHRSMCYSQRNEFSTSLVDFVNLPDLKIIQFCIFRSLFDLSAILKIRNWEHAHYLGLVVVYTWNREKQMFVALGKEFDMIHNNMRNTILNSPNSLFSS